MSQQISREGGGNSREGWNKLRVLLQPEVTQAIAVSQSLAPVRAVTWGRLGLLPVLQLRPRAQRSRASPGFHPLVDGPRRRGLSGKGGGGSRWCFEACGRSKAPRGGQPRPSCSWQGARRPVWNGRRHCHVGEHVAEPGGRSSLYNRVWGLGLSQPFCAPSRQEEGSGLTLSFLLSLPQPVLLSLLRLQSWCETRVGRVHPNTEVHLEPCNSASSWGLPAPIPHLFNLQSLPESSC